MKQITNINWYRYLPPPLDPSSHTHKQSPVNLSQVLFTQFVLQEYWQFSPNDCTQTVYTKKNLVSFEREWRYIFFLKYVSNLWIAISGMITSINHHQSGNMSYSYVLCKTNARTFLTWKSCLHWTFWNKGWILEKIWQESHVIKNAIMCFKARLFDF